MREVLVGFIVATWLLYGAGFHRDVTRLQVEEYTWSEWLDWLLTVLLGPLAFVLHAVLTLWSKRK